IVTGRLMPPGSLRTIDGAGLDGRSGAPRRATWPRLFQVFLGCGAPPVKGMGNARQPDSRGRLTRELEVGGRSQAKSAKVDLSCSDREGGWSMRTSRLDPGATETERSSGTPGDPFTKRTFPKVPRPEFTLPCKHRTSGEG